MNQNVHSYFMSLTEGMAQLLNQVFREEKSSLFRRPAQVKVSLSESGADDYQLLMVGKQFKDKAQGTFNAPHGGDRVLVFRSPVEVTATFRLSANSPNPTRALNVLDRLTTYFFDHRSIEAIVPSSFKEYPKLYERLIGKRAEIKMLNPQQSLDDRSSDSFDFYFEYTALYHSGNPLKEEKRVSQRVIDYENERNERTERRVQ